MNNEILLLGCNYNHIDYRNLNYTTNIAKISRHFKKNEILFKEITNVEDTNYNSILLALYKIALNSWVSKLNTVLIYYTGDSIDIAEYISGYNSNYNINEGIVPTDYNIRKGDSVIKPEIIFNILNSFNPSTKIIFIVDTCFTKTNIFNLNFDWDINNKKIKSKNTINTNHTINNIIVISYCLDKLSSDDDNFYNILDINKDMISLGDYIIKIRKLLDNSIDTKNNYDIFNILKDINGIIKNKKINMNVSLSSSYNLLNKREYLSILDKDEEILEDIIEDNKESFQDYIDNSYVEVKDINKPIFIDIPLSIIDNENSSNTLKIPKVIKAPIVPKLPINTDAPILIDSSYTRTRTTNENNDFNRCSHSSFNETPRYEQFTPRQSKIFDESPRVIYSQYQQPIQKFYNIPLNQYAPNTQQVQQVRQVQHQAIQYPRHQYQRINNYYNVPLQQSYIQNNQNRPYNNYDFYNHKIQQDFVLKSSIVSNNTNQNYYEPPNSFANECYC